MASGRGVREGAGLYWRALLPVFMAEAGEPGALTGWLHGATGVGMGMVGVDAAVRGVDAGMRDLPL